MDRSIPRRAGKDAPGKTAAGREVLDAWFHGALHVHLHCIDRIFLHNVGYKMTYNTFIETVMKNANIELPVAEKIFSYYKKIKVITQNAHDGISVKHGALLDNEILLRALQEMN